MLPWNDAENDYVDARIGNSPSGGDGNWEGVGDGQGLIELSHWTRHPVMEVSSQPTPDDKQSPG